MFFMLLDCIWLKSEWGIIDIKDVYLYEFPIASLLHMTKRLTAGYKLRTYKVLIVNVHWLLASASQILFTFLPSHIAEKISIQGGNGAKDLLKFIDPDHLEKKFGGNLPNKTSDFFPPRFNPWVEKKEHSNYEIWTI